MVPPLRSNRLVLREWQDDDLESFAGLVENPVVMEHLLPMKDRAAIDAMAQRIRDHFAEHGFGYLAVELPGVSSFIGMVGLVRVTYAAHFTPAVEIGWRIDPDHWGQGYATEAATLALDDAFDRLKLQEVVALTVPANIRSRRVMDRLGMTRVETDDFDHPLVPDGHALKRHVLYRLQSHAWRDRTRALQSA
jgi:RimJ/RimL family protein N-acetyltransferase